MISVVFHTIIIFLGKIIIYRHLVTHTPHGFFGISHSVLILLSSSIRSSEGGGRSLARFPERACGILLEMETAYFEPAPLTNCYQVIRLTHPHYMVLRRLSYLLCQTQYLPSLRLHQVPATLYWSHQMQHHKRKTRHSPVSHVFLKLVICLIYRNIRFLVGCDSCVGICF